MEAATVPPVGEDVEAAEAAPFEGRARRTARRRRGVIPGNLRQRIDGATQDFFERHAARIIAGQLDGLHPSALTDEERAELRQTWGERCDPVLELLAQAGYGAAPPRRSRAERAHGLRRETRLHGVLGKLPRAIALTLPTTADTHREGGERNDGAGPWGPVKCSRTLRPDHMGALAAVGGLWHSRAAEHDTHVDLTAGELVQLLTGRRRVGGKDVAWVHGLLADWETLEVQADVRDRPNKEPRRGREDPSGPSEAHRIPGSPIDRVERRVGDRWVAADEYAAALAAGGDADLVELREAERAECRGVATIRVHLAAWFRQELAHPKRRAVFINFDVWAHLRPQARRTYALVQALGRDDYDRRVYFFLGAPLLYVLGLSGERLDRAGNIVSDDLTALWHADRRYHEGGGFRRHKHATTNIPAFACDPARQPSAPTPKALTTKSLPKRPGALRGAVGRMRRHAIVAARGVSPEQLDPAHVRRVGVEAAKREAELVRQAVQRSLVDAAASGRERGPFDPSKAAAWRRQHGRDDDDDPAGD